MDANTQRFILRDGVTFNDGSIFAADDVIFSLYRARRGEEIRSAQPLTASGAGGGNVTDVVFTAIDNARMLVSALMSGEMDLVMPLPLQDIPCARRGQAVKIVSSAEAGYADGFERKMNCPTDHDVDDGQNCQDTVSMLARFTVNVNLAISPKRSFSPMWSPQISTHCSSC